ncbi:MAG: hypothetical protein ACRCT7_17755 [Shewanella sp.]|uniref:hypothetical protein n=1 Tax=Shewanella sp. SNU WT4 TaxID=2590015 RepID=UPI00143DD0FB|nr:hypothetical protein [Shewanella sp. SNU WT4]
MSTRSPANNHFEPKASKLNYEQMADDFVTMFTAIAKQRHGQVVEQQHDVEMSVTPKLK